MDNDKSPSSEAKLDASSEPRISETKETPSKQNQQVEAVEAPITEDKTEPMTEDQLAAAFLDTAEKKGEQSMVQKTDGISEPIENKSEQAKKSEKVTEVKKNDNMPTEEEVAAAFVEPKPKTEEKHAEVQEESGGDSEDNIASGASKSHKGLIATIACSVVIVAGIATAIMLNSNQKQEAEPVVAINDLTDEQKEKLGVEPTKEENVDSSEIEDKDNYSDEYKKYLELSDEEKAELEVIPRKEEIPDEKIDEIKEDTDDNVIAALPERFDLRDVIDITVGNQGGYGLCWDYASSTALETHLKLRGIDYNPSELQIDFLSSNLMYGGRNLHDGGTFQYFADMASSIGTISEDAFSSLSIDPNAWYGGTSNNLDYFKLTKNDSPLYVTKTVDFPSIYKSEGEVSGKTEEELKEYRDLVKAHIMTNGSLYTAVAGPWGFGVPRYCENSGTGCYMNHAMAIIGWDDNYPKENFAKVDSNGNRIEGTPKHDGAYIILNSWGKEWDGSGAQDGVFYISYDEYNVESQLSGVVSTSLDNTKKIDSIASKAAKDLIKEKLSFYIFEEDDGEYISDYALDRVSYLDLSSRGLTDYDLKGITETFSNISSLTITNNNISDLSSLANLKNLYGVYFSKNNVEDISVLCTMDKVNGLDLSYNRITDVSCLEGKLGDYAYLDISGNRGITGFDKLTTLHSLTANDIGLEGLESLSGLNKLTSLSVRDNNIKSLTGLNTDEDALYNLDLSGNKELTDLTFNKPVYRLSIKDANLTDISILNNIEASGVFASGNNFGDLSSFNNDKIVQLDLSENKNLSNLSALATVENLNLSDCGITSLTEIDNIDGIKVLTLNDNEISSLDGAENLSRITTLSISNNKLTSLNGLEKLENLQSFNVANNQISSLDGVAKLAKLTTFSADNNNISDANALTDLENLYFVSLNNNKLTSVPNFTAQADVYLAFENNPIENVVIPKAVATINLKDCGVKTIDYSSVEKLTNITLVGNPDWNEYRNLISKSILGQQNLGRSNPYFSVSTDYNFSKKELNDLDGIPGLYGRANWYMSLEKYMSELEKSSDGTVNLEKYPSERAMFMLLLKSGTSLNGFTVDKAATKLTLEDKTIDSLSLEQWIRINNNTHMSTNKIMFNFKQSQ